MTALGDSRPSRRALLASAIVAPATLSLAGCGVRLERDSPDLPVLKTQDPPPDRAVLLATLRSLQGVLRVAERTDDEADPWVAPIRIAHRAQITRLVDTLASLGVDVPTAAGSTSPAPSPTGTRSSPATSETSGPATSSGHPTVTGSERARSLADAEGSFPTAATEQKAWAASAANRPMLVSVCAARRAAQALLGGDPSLPRGAPPASASAAAVARAIRPAAYGFEQIAAKTPTKDRAQVTATLRWLSGARNDLAPVVDEPEQPSYAMPVRVTDSASAKRLAQALLADVLKAVASQTSRVGDERTPVQQWAFRVWLLAAADHTRWGGPVAPFPGLRT